MDKDNLSDVISELVEANKIISARLELIDSDGYHYFGSVADLIDYLEKRREGTITFLLT